jgi:hypothetical protein
VGGVKSRKRKSHRGSPAVWPAQYLVVVRTNLDELPILLTPDRKTANITAMTVTNEHANHAAKLMQVDYAGRCCSAIISFRNGKPYRIRIMKDWMEVNEQESQASTPVEKSPMEGHS